MVVPHEVKDIHRNTEVEIPYIKREIIPSPNSPNEILTPGDSLSFLRDTRLISRGAKILAGSLLREGNVVKFPGGIGIDYEDIYKVIFDPRATSVAYREMIKQNNLRNKIDVVIVPEYSAIAPGTLMAALLGKPVIRLRKNGNHNGKVFAGQIDSYTGGGRDTLFFAERTVNKLQKDGQKRWMLFDDISDTGGMTTLVSEMVKIMQRYGYDFNLIASGATLAKGYTGAAQKIQELGILNFAGLIISDLGLDPQPWISIEGINDVSFSFYRTGELINHKKAK